MKLKTKDLLTLDELTDNELSKIIDDGTGHGRSALGGELSAFFERRRPT